MAVLTHKERRDRDIYTFVRTMEAKTLNGQQMYRFAYILERASDKFYLTPDTIADIVREYVPPVDDPAQLNMFVPPTANAATTPTPK